MQMTLSLNDVYNYINEYIIKFYIIHNKYYNKKFS